DFDLSLLVVTSALKQRGQSRHIMRTKDSINPWSVGDDRVFILLRQTTTNGNMHAGVVFFGLFLSTYRTVETLVCIFTHGAGIKDDKVRFSFLLCRNIAGLFQ